MKSPRFLAGLLAFVVSAPSAFALLPALKEPPWLGYFAVYANRHYQFGITSMGKITLTPMDDKGKPVNYKLAIPLEVFVEETMPDGKIVQKQVQAATVESSDQPTDKFTKALIRGKVTGDASFELHIEQDRGVISIGGRLVEPGKLKDPKFSIRATFPDAYPYDKKSGDKKEEKAFEKKIKDDRIDMKYTDGKRKKQSFEAAVDASSKDICGPGISAAEIEIGGYKGKKFLVMATENTAFTLSNGKTAPLHEGFSVVWVPDVAKDKDGKARLSIEVK